MSIQNILTFQDLMLLNKNEAIKKYGIPHSKVQFLLNNRLSRFRQGLYKVFKKEEILKNTILIDELTWEKDKNTWVTVWYQNVELNAEPKSSYKWKKGTDFYNS